MTLWRRDKFDKRMYKTGSTLQPLTVPICAYVILPSLYYKERTLWIDPHLSLSYGESFLTFDFTSAAKCCPQKIDAQFGAFNTFNTKVRSLIGVDNFQESKKL